jgi:hypothetical protein
MARMASKVPTASTIPIPSCKLSLISCDLVANETEARSIVSTTHGCFPGSTLHVIMVEQVRAAQVCEVSGLKIKAYRMNTADDTARSRNRECLRASVSKAI